MQGGYEMIETNERMILSSIFFILFHIAYNILQGVWKGEQDE